MEYGDVTPVWTEAQIHTAVRVLHQVNQHGGPPGAHLIAIACAIDESELLCLASETQPDSFTSQWRQGISAGDATSVGPFQQQKWWGPTDDRMNPYGSTQRFLTGGDDGSPGLFAHHGWQQMDPAIAISAVQRNADGAAPYRDAIRRGRSLLAALTAGAHP